MKSPRVIISMSTSVLSYGDVNFAGWWFWQFKTVDKILKFNFSNISFR